MDDKQKTNEQLISELVDLRQQIGAPAALQNERTDVKTESTTTEVRLQYVLAVCPAIIYSTEASGDFACTFVSENIEPILGYTQREMRDDPDFWTSHIHPQDTRGVLSEVHRLVSEGGGELE